MNGSAVPFRVVKSNGETLVSVRDLANAVGAKIAIANGVITVSLNGHAVDVKLNAKTIAVDGASVSLLQAVRSVNGASYMALRPLVNGLGGTVGINAGQIVVSTVQLLAGAENPRFVAGGKVLVSTTSDEGSRTDYLVSEASGKYETVMTSSNTSDLVVSPDGTHAAYSNSDGAVYTIDLATKSAKLVTSDNNIKPELVWSPDSKTIYFLQGDKGSVIAKIDLATGTITTILDDKIDYKSGLNVSPDGTKFIYTVTTLGTVTSDATNVDEDNVSIDYSANQAQLFAFDSTVTDGKPVKLTTSTDDKLFVNSADGKTAYYVSVPSEDQAASVVSVGSDLKVNTVFSSGDVIDTALSNGKLYVLAAAGGNNTITEIDLATGAKKPLYTVSADVSSLVVNGSQFAVINNDVVYVNDGQAWKAITK